jgi:Flp pilus assembly pilin Flp
MNRMIPLYVTLSSFVQHKAARVQKRYIGDDRGASIIEYVALLFVVALIVAAIHAAKIDETVKNKTTDALNKIFQ